MERSYQLLFKSSFLVNVIDTNTDALFGRVTMAKVGYLLTNKKLDEKGTRRCCPQRSAAIACSDDVLSQSSNNHHQQHQKQQQQLTMKLHQRISLLVFLASVSQHSPLS
jgi:hypothetical protein